MFFFLLNQSSIWCFLKSLKTTTAFSFCFWSPWKILTATRFIKNSLMIAPCSCFFDTLYTQRANFNSAIPPIVQTALSAGNVLMRLCRSNAHHKRMSQQQAEFTNLLSVPAVLFPSNFQLLFPFKTKQTGFPARTATSYRKNPTHLKTKNWLSWFFAKHSVFLSLQNLYDPNIPTLTSHISTCISETSPSPKAISPSSCLPWGKMSVVHWNAPTFAVL